MRSNITRKLEDTTNYLQKLLTDVPHTGIILGSGLGIMAEEINNAIHIPYSEIPHFPTTTVKGHKGQLVIGELEAKKVLAMQGRFHYYEGYSMEDVVYPVRVMSQINIKNLIITNAAGGINTRFKPGDLMLINDHINLMGSNPLRGQNIDLLGLRFPDMSEAYSQHLREIAKNVSAKLEID